MQQKITKEDQRDRETMLRIYQERGAQTEKTLLAAGISVESQARNAPWVAEQVKLAEAA
ncbi:hypothetical protein HJB56_04965 [Rhizobium lentis]|uniref:hypothetical protein n=1 Tax=Rhizobium lentis TaxID=1138194 RepID=UPI001C83B0AB|nr:hypothetical protein [Rhizobium lentis]MBX5082137.1 hypothetical protein [Rhizobium lentis]MBX5094847.1 hypothetical protein [Rhizobium lentis]MBX5119572.1 hypothetical protein [Rhizobium lentis]